MQQFLFFGGGMGMTITTLNYVIKIITVLFLTLNAAPYCSFSAYSISPAKEYLQDDPQAPLPTKKYLAIYIRWAKHITQPD